jgi:uncharacterized protein
MGRARARVGSWLLRRSDGSVACHRCVVADTPSARMRGLLGRSGLEEGECLLITPANSVHMLFMRFAIDVVFVDRDMVVRKIVEALKPWRMAGCLGARSALELPAGAASRHGITVGERLALEPAHG